MRQFENDAPVLSRTEVEADGRIFIVEAPRWTEWQAALDRASSDRQGPADPRLLLEECLLVCVRAAEGSAITRKDLRELPAPDGDKLLAAALAMIAGQREALRLSVEPCGRGTKIRADGMRLLLKPWTFGERNDALRRSLQLQEGRVRLDLGLYEKLMIAACVTWEDGGEGADPAEWPVPLGETVMRELDRLNGVDPDYEDTAAACLRSGIDHPDLAMIRLCRAFRWSPEQIEPMNARMGESLLAGLRVLERQAAAAAHSEGTGVNSLPSSSSDTGVTRIVILEE
ncbi:hypothetical protein E5161_07205 [Cohnella pontilimi]|uniref:Uncharacterized protein n=1 Tax=Cohnella pontilimi TaxID=2564100 RepID=A0A4U0FCM6_9BACL|nr:hypothetical protein [Cohnella pontilimi]TJY42633.1 hypothetical protein E5161_07205 [Cohnella pontilimi]